MSMDPRALLGGVLESMSASVRAPLVEAPMGTPSSVQADVAEPEPTEPDLAPGQVLDVDEPVPAGGDFGSADSRERGTSRHAWGGHANGRIPDDELVSIGGGHRLEADAAGAWTEMVAAAAADGISLGLTDSYRDFDAQVDVRRRKGDQVATATPGTSIHGWGHAVDVNLNNEGAFEWLRANGGRFGWIWPEWAQREGKSFERWHWEYVGGQDG